MISKRKNGLSKRLLSFAMCLALVLSFITIVDKPLDTKAASAGYNDDYAWQVLDIVNQERAAAGLPALTMDVNLVSTAKVRAGEIVTKFDHTRPDGTSCFSAFPSGLGWRGENIAAGQGNPSAVMTGWMNSSGHRANIMSSNFKSIGIACYYVPGSQYGYYWVQCFGGKVLQEATRTTAASTASTVYNGVDYSAVYDYNYYINKYSDLKAAFGSDSNAALAHFVNNGMNEGRQAKADFNVDIYKSNYADLRAAFGSITRAYYIHYINNGKAEGRNAKTLINTGSSSSGSGASTTPSTNTTTTTTTNTPSGPTVYNGVDYSAVYDYNYYINNYSDLKAAFGSNSAAALQHFVMCGMSEGRQAKASFNVNVYRNNYSDLRAAFGNDLRAYYLHYIANGKNEGRNASSGSATPSAGNGSAVYNGVDYSAVYDYNYYINNYSDLKAAFGNNQAAALEHFVVCGMSEGRQAKADFNVSTYQSRYGDLRSAFGGDLRQYYLHYINYGKSEGRSAK